MKTVVNTIQSINAIDLFSSHVKTQACEVRGSLYSSLTLLPDDKILDLSNSKGFADDTLLLDQVDLSGAFSPLTSVEAGEKSSQWLWKESCVSTGVRKPGNTCDMTLAVKVALNPNTTNQPT